MNTPQQPSINSVPTTSAASVIWMPPVLAIAIAVAAIAVAHPARAEAPNAPDEQDGNIHQEGGEYWKNSRQTFPLNADGQFSVDTINGRIEVHGWSSNAVVLVTAIHGNSRKDVDAVKINIDSDAKHIVIHTEQQNDDRNKATVDYTVQVPEQARLKGVSSVNGSIAIDGVAGDINASTVNGGVEIKDACRNLKLDTVNGSITAEMNKLGSGQTVSFNTVNGAIKLGVPEDADAKFTFSTLNGSISSDFQELREKKDFPAGNSLKASLGNGDGRVKGETVNGRIEISKHPRAKEALASPKNQVH
jgi:DUF4097 and DUF4098 domain-containing protein YvlB